jgi:hypothetical protein
VDTRNNLNQTIEGNNRVKTTKVRAEIVTATRELVDTLLSINTKNRKLRQSHIDYLKKEMLQGRWELTSQGIGVTASGVLSDGQNRLMALKEAGYPPLEILLVTGLSDTAQIKTDNGAKRNVADLLRIHLNQSVSNLLVASINVISRMTDGERKLSPEQVAELLVEYAEEIEQLQKVEGANSLNAPVYAALLYSIKTTQNQSLLDFARQVISGVNLQENDPAYVLRKFLQSGPVGKKGGQNVQVDRFGRTIYAIEAYIKGQKISRVYYKELPSKVELYLKSRMKAA